MQPGPGPPRPRRDHDPAVMQVGAELAVQAFELDVSGFPATLLAASNGLLIRAASSGCP